MKKNNPSAQDNTKARLQDVGASARLVDISLKEFQATLSVPPYLVDFDNLKLDFSLDVSSENPPNQLITQVTMFLEGTGAKDEPILYFRAVYWGIYTLADGPLDPSALKMFADLNAPFHLYPYFRELVDNHSRKMSLARPLILPLFRPAEIGKQRKPRKAQATPT